MIVVALRGVSLRLDGTVALSSIDWTVARGESWAVIGPNGAGKSSLLRVAGLARHPSTGTVEVLGHTLGRTDVRALRGRIAVSSPALAERLEPRMTAREVVVTARHGALAPWWHTYEDADRRRAGALLERFGVGTRAEHRWPTLSAGERQRVLLARALMREPELLLLDEPTAGLDLAAREDLLADLDRLARDPAAVPLVLVTHHLEEVPPATTHALVLRDGRVVAQGPIAHVLTDAVLSEAFATSLRVRRDGDGRWTARLGAGGRAAGAP